MSLIARCSTGVTLSLCGLSNEYLDNGSFNPKRDRRIRQFSVGNPHGAIRSGWR